MTNYPLPETHFTILERHKKVTLVHHVERSGDLWATRGRTILRKHGSLWEKISRFPAVWPRDLFGWWRPLARAFRSDKCNLYVNKAGNVLGIRGGRVYALRNKRMVALFALQGDCVLHGSLCEDEYGWTYFGEYFMNPKRGPVRIWRIDPTLTQWEVAYEFPAGCIRHVHGIYRDPFEPSALWATVGDYEGECFFICSYDRFATFQRFGDGSQVWRAVRLFFTAEYIGWLTDSHIEDNHACRMSRLDGSLEIGQPLDCSGWYGAETRECAQVAFTTVERGPAIKRKQASILFSQDAFHWAEVHAFDKDWWRPMQLFKYGVINCPTGTMRLDDFWISGEGLVDLDGCSLHVSIRTSEAPQ